MAAVESTGLKKETAAALSTLLGPTLVVPVLFLLLEKDAYVRFWAMQSIVTFGFLFLLNWVLIFSVVLAFFAGLVWIAGVILLLVMTYKAWQGQEWEVPFLGKFARKFLKKV